MNTQYLFAHRPGAVVEVLLTPWTGVQLGCEDARLQCFASLCPAKQHASHVSCQCLLPGLHARQPADRAPHSQWPRVSLERRRYVTKIWLGPTIVHV